MKKVLSFLILSLLFLSCSKPVLTDENNMISEELSEFLQTKSDAPLAGSVWEFNSGDEFNSYITFTETDVKLFYGLVDNGELQRWSDFYSAPYKIENGVISTDLSYPFYGKTEKTEHISIIKKLNYFSISINENEYLYYGKYTDDLDMQWVIVFVNIVPWK